MPPTIEQGPIPHKFYRYGGEIELRCKANGIPEPE